MSLSIIQERLSSYQTNTVLEQEHALKEIAQEIALMALARTGFFKIAAFQGGTCLRILYGLERFSEDLDFSLLTPNLTFTWQPHLQSMSEEFKAYGFALEVQDRTKINKAVKIAFLKADSAGGLLIIKDLKTHQPKLRIKLEMDTNPPEGAHYDLKYLDFPMSFSIQTHDVPSLFSGKCHALLCRPYVKGRDWYDFVWYIARKTPINFPLLTQALQQAGPWAGQAMAVTPSWLIHTFTEKINTLDWDLAKQDVAVFLKPKDLPTLETWSPAFFHSRVEKLKEYLKETVTF